MAPFCTSSFPLGPRLPAFLSEMARVLRPGGRAALLMTRAHARQMQQLLGFQEETWAASVHEEAVEDSIEPVGEEQSAAATDPHSLKQLERAFRQLACHKVGVGGWPAAVLALERLTGDVSAQEAPPSPEAHVKGKGLKGKGKGAGKSAQGEPRECLLIESPLSCPSLRLVDYLMQRWPSHFPTESVSRRVMGRGRVWVQEEGHLRQAWWSEPVTMKTVVFLPDYPRRSPYEGQLTVLYQDDHVGVVFKEPRNRARVVYVLISGRSSTRN